MAGSIFGRGTAVMCVLVALCMLLPAVPIRGGDVGTDVVEHLNTPGGFEARDIKWDNGGWRGVVVGYDQTGSGHCAYVYYPRNDTWINILTLGADMALNGVDWDAPNDEFIFVGGDQLTEDQAVFYHWYEGTAPVPTACPPTDYYKDVALFSELECVVVAKDRPLRFMNPGGPWIREEVVGPFPLTSGELNSVFWDEENYLTWVIGQDVGGNGLAYYSYNGLGFYESSPQNPYEPAFRCGDYSLGAGYGLVAGVDKVIKLDDSVSSPSWQDWPAYGGPQPSPRYGASIVWLDWPYNIFFMFGGYSETGYANDVWLYSPFAKRWIPKGGYSTEPSQRYGYGLAYDPMRQVVVVYGGNGGSGTNTDTWEWNPALMDAPNAWSLRMAASPPGALYYTRMVFCDYDGLVYLYGGGGTGIKNRFFTWDGAVWVNRAQGGPSPSMLEHGMAYQPIYQRIVLYGGQGTEGTTLVYDPTSNMMTQPSVSGTPPPLRQCPVLLYTYRHYYEVTMYGGYNSGMSRFNNEVWRFHVGTNTWTHQSISQGFPLGQSYHAGAACPVDNEVYYFAGQSQMGPFSNNTYHYGRVLNATATVLRNETGEAWNAVDWYPDGHEAILAGANGQLLRHVYNTDLCQPIPNTVHPSSNFRAVGCKVRSSPGYAWVIGTPGGGVKINDISGGSQVDVNVVPPHVSWFWLWDNTWNSAMNKQNDIDAGTNTTWCEVQPVVGHPGGSDLITQIDVYLWYDQGNMTTDFPSLVTPAFDSPGWGNARMHFRWTNMGIFQQIYPPPAADEETTLMTWACSWGVYNAENITVTFRFAPHQQVFASGSNMGPEMPGSMYGGGGFLGQSTLNALNSPSNWDVKVVAYASASTASAFDEFGFFRYTYLSSAMLPGPLTGSGAPGSMVHLTPVSHITFSANCAYQLLVHLENNLIGQTYGQVIPVTRMAVMGGDLYNLSAFPPYEEQNFGGIGPANAMFLLGNPVIPRAPNPSGRYTTTAVGPVGPVSWRCWVPSVAEDNYIGTVTYTVTWP
jgi:hypothetical protein